jgi:hypothetical protein
MEWLGLCLGILGLAVGLFPLADIHIPSSLQKPLLYMAFVLLVSGVVVGVAPLRKPLRLQWRLTFGPYPFLLIYLFLDKIAEAKGQKIIRRLLDLALRGNFFSENWTESDVRDKTMHKLIEAAAQGKFTLYGRLLSEYGIRRLRTKLPRDHIETHGINTSFAIIKNCRNDLVFTYDPRKVSPGDLPEFMNGCYCDLHVSPSIKSVIKEIRKNAPIKAR